MSPLVGGGCRCEGGGLEEAYKCNPLAIRAPINQYVGRRSSVERNIGIRAGRTKRCAEIRASQILADALSCREKEELVLDEWTTDTSTELIATGILQRLSIRSGGGQRFCAEGFQTAAIYPPRPHLCYSTTPPPRC